MLSYHSILESARKQILRRYPGETVCLYRAEPERPAFLLELGPVELAEASRDSLELKVTVKATAYAADGAGEALAERMRAVQELFASEGLRPEGRVLSS